MTHYASPDFWACYQNLPDATRDLADRAFRILKSDLYHPSLHFKKVGEYWSARIGLHYRAIAVEVPDGMLWFWIGTHAEYDRLVG